MAIYGPQKIILNDLQLKVLLVFLKI